MSSAHITHDQVSTTRRAPDNQRALLTGNLALVRAAATEPPAVDLARQLLAALCERLHLDAAVRVLCS